MSGLAFLIPIALGLGVLGLAAFFWAMRKGQFEDLDGAAGETAHRKLRRALHEEHDAVALHQFVDALLDVAHGDRSRSVAVGCVYTASRAVRLIASRCPGRPPGRLQPGPRGAQKA